MAEDFSRCTLKELNNKNFRDSLFRLLVIRGGRTPFRAMNILQLMLLPVKDSSRGLCLPDLPLELMR